jgi:hypothetical protein
MKAFLKTVQEWVDLGPDSAAGLHRAARLLRKDVFQCIELDRRVPTARWVAGVPIAFGDLVAAGLVRRDIEPGDFLDPDGYTVIYTVIDKVSFVDMYGHRWVQGTSERWEK